MSCIALAVRARVGAARLRRPRKKKTVTSELDKLYDGGHDRPGHVRHRPRDPGRRQAPDQAADRRAQGAARRRATRPPRAMAAARRAARRAPAPALPHAAAQPRVVVGEPAARERRARRRSRAPSWSGSTSPARASSSTRSRTSASSTRTRRAPSATTRATRCCSTSCCRSRSRAAAASRGSTTSRSTAARRRGSAGSRRAPACRRSRARAQKLGRSEELLPIIQKGLTLFEQKPPTGVRVQTPDGHPLRPVLVLAEPADHQRLRPVARRALRRRADHRRPARGQAVRRRRRDGAQGGPDVRHRRVVVLLARGDHAGVRPQLPHAAARLPHEPLRPHRRRGVLRRGDALHRLPDGAARCWSSAPRACAAGRRRRCAFTLSKISRTSVTVTAPNGTPGAVGRGGHGRPRHAHGELDGAAQGRRLHGPDRGDRPRRATRSGSRARVEVLKPKRRGK